MTNSEKKQIKALSQKKFRDQSGLFIAEGEKLVAEALKSDFEVLSVFRTSEIGEDQMKQISELTHPSPVLAVIRQKKTDGYEIKNGLYLALDAIRDPGNLGTIIRIADWFGIDAVFCSPDTVEMYNPKVVQATMGAIFRVKIIYTDLEALAERVVKAGGKFYGTFLDGNDIYTEELETGADAPSVIIIGNEANGISESIEKKVNARLYIPPFPPDESGSESLNAAVATAVCVAEFRRRLQYGR